MIKQFCCQYRWLSNFWYSWVEIDGKKYRTVEHGYQAMKTLDLEEREKIRLCSSPILAKRLGRKVTLREDWEEVKVEVMLGLLRQKFSQKNFRDMLLSTGEQEIVEGNHWHDCEWGVCYCSGCGGKGQNILGKLIVQIREELRGLFEM